MNKTSTRDNFTNNLNAYSEMCTLTFKDMAAEIDVPYTTFLNWSSGKAFPTPEKLDKLAVFFNTTPSRLIAAPTTGDEFRQARVNKLLSYIETMDDKKLNKLLKIAEILEE